MGKLHFRRYHLKARLVHRSYTLRGAINSKRPTTNNCGKGNCLILNSGICHRANVVYDVECQACKQHYIGSTVRHLHERLEEHLSVPSKRSSSSVHRHVTRCLGREATSSDIAVSILASDPDPVNLRLREQLLINRLKPSINSREEYAAFSHLAF